VTQLPGESAGDAVRRALETRLPAPSPDAAVLPGWRDANEELGFPPGAGVFAARLDAQQVRPSPPERCRDDPAPETQQISNVETDSPESEATREEKSWSRAAQVLTASVDGKGVFDSPDGSERALVVDVAGLLQAVTVSPPVQQTACPQAQRTFSPECSCPCSARARLRPSAR
jgi:hypothetical protein